MAVNASVRTLRPASGRAEHISLETEPDVPVATTRPGRRAVRSTYTLKSALRGCATELRLLEDHFVSVHSVRPGNVVKDYVLDLRFVNAKPRRVRHVAWMWLMLTVTLILLTAAAVWFAHSSATLRLPLILSGVALFGSSLGCLLMFLRRTTESLEFISAHGNTALISITGGIGSARSGKSFFVTLIKSITAAKAARAQTKPQFLRDEMREHHRLRELGALSEAEYAASKLRILAAHE